MDMQEKLIKSRAENETLLTSNAEKCRYIEVLENQKSELGPILDQTKQKVEKYEHNEKLLRSRIDVLIAENMKSQSMIEGEKSQNENKDGENKDSENENKATSCLGFFLIVRFPSAWIWSECGGSSNWH